MNKLVIVDGHNLLFRMFYGVPARMRSKDGKLVNGVIGFIGGILKYIRMFEPDYFLVIFDSEQPCYRNAMYHEYKANRQSDFGNVEDDENPFVQLNIIKNVLDILCIKYCEIDGFETDDVIASYLSRYLELQSYVISWDSDLLQLVNDNTFVFMDRGKNSILFDKAKIVGKFGISADNIIDYKSLVGDKTDNISGVPGIGSKTAVKLISNYGNIETISNSLAQIYPDSLRSKIRNNLELLRLNKSIITLRNNVDLPIKREDLKISLNTYSGIKTIGILKDNNYI
jgi:DNA polymerase I